jgi:hypothetical protein
LKIIYFFSEQNRNPQQRLLSKHSHSNYNPTANKGRPVQVKFLPPSLVQIPISSKTIDEPKIKRETKEMVALAKQLGVFIA